MPSRQHLVAGYLECLAYDDCGLRGLGEVSSARVGKPVRSEEYLAYEKKSVIFMRRP
jgi:hypothetical protein